ncbi:MAG TPA: tol-pal system protein YbgF [Candidatus Binatia bacterium]|nr:tol-pal system protein YbgF [Candidatus Binatia bacterium]
MLVAKSARALGRAPVTVGSARRQWLALAALVAGATGCATQADVQFVRDDVAEARKQAADAKAMVDGVKVDFEKLRGEFETLKYQSAGGGKLEDLMRRLDALDARIAAVEQSRGPVTGTPAPGGEAVAAVAPTPGGPESALASVPIPPSAPAEYRDGIELLRSGDNGGAIQKLREFLRKSPKADLADDAQYWIGEAYYANRDYNRAILEFNEVLLRYPKGDKVPAALLHQAMAFAELGDKVDARLVLQKLVSEHGDSPEAEKGRQKLAELSS